VQEVGEKARQARRTCAITVAKGATGPMTTPVTSPRRIIHITEQQVFADHGPGE
jgi:hypothetical protein